MIPTRFCLAILWLAAVLLLGTAQFGPKQTQQHVVPTLRTLAPWMGGPSLQTMHAVLRKLSHCLEYAVLAFLWVRAFRAHPGLSWKAASWAALALCVACAVVDEVHQAQVPGRQGSAADVVLDSVGALTMLMVVRGRRQAVDAAAAPGDSRPALTTIRLDEGA